MYCIETEQLSFNYAAQNQILNDLGLQVPYGAIYGFLGANGAGKTTTLRLMLGLIRKQKGTIRLFGKSIATDRIEILKRTGSLIESPSLYGNLTAAENLRAFRYSYQCPEKRIREVLEMVGLPDTGNKKAGKFSLGMKQRLGIAMALLHNPELLILDEPTNGLDPNGIIEIRALLKKLNQEQGMTILVSSHLLAEIEKLVSHVGIIHKGALLFQDTLQALSKQQTGAAVSFETSDTDSTLAVLARNNITPLSREGMTVTIPAIEKELIAQINGQLHEAAVKVYGINAQRNDLESIFINLVK